MADYTTITDSAVSPDAPITSQLGFAFRDNPIAIAEGATGAPRVLDGALSGTVTAAGRSWVGARVATIPTGNIGSFIFATYVPDASLSYGDTALGSNLRPSNVTGTAGVASLIGTWQCLGVVASGGGVPSRTTLFRRVS